MCRSYQNDEHHVQRLLCLLWLLSSPGLVFWICIFLRLWLCSDRKGLIYLKKMDSAKLLSIFPADGNYLEVGSRPRNLQLCNPAAWGPAPQSQQSWGDHLVWCPGNDKQKRSHILQKDILLGKCNWHCAVFHCFPHLVPPPLSPTSL